jgi:homoserine kinase
MTQGVVVAVPASTSNLGAGFDCVGAAVDRWLTVTVRFDDQLTAPVIAREGTLVGLQVGVEDDLLLVGFRAACAARGFDAPPGIHAQAHSEIPIGRGLGSSAAATVAGAAAANALLTLELDDRTLLRVCSTIEGHADNVAPAILGGACLVIEGDAPVVAPLAVHSGLALVFAIPEFAIETALARRILPSHVPHATAARGAAHAAALVRGLETADGALLSTGLNDVLHVPFRETLVPGFAAVVDAAQRTGAFGATLSGSGSAIVAIAPRARASDVAAAMCSAWRAVGVRAEAFVNPHHVPGHSTRSHQLAETNQTLHHQFAKSDQGDSLCL